MPIKLSFCTTCKGRLWQLRETLPRNLERIARDGFSEIVLLNYNSQDDLDNWIDGFIDHIAAGRLTYLHETESEIFQASQAKNIAHFAASGDYLINLDGDNFINESIVKYRQAIEGDGSVVIHGTTKVPRDGTFGRIGMPRAVFEWLGGYDERFQPMGFQDLDLLVRARAAKMKVVSITDAQAIKNSLQDKLLFTGHPQTELEFSNMNLHNKYLSSLSVKRGLLRVNGGRKLVRVRVNKLFERFV